MTQPTITARAQRTDVADEQYSLTKILIIWAVVAAPMGFITWIAVPFLEPRLDVDPGFVFLIMITLGLIWQGVVSYIILRKEVVPFTWANLKERLWIETPTNPRTKVRSKRMYLWTIPAIVAIFLWDQLEVLGWLNGAWVNLFPGLEAPDYAIFEDLADIAEGHWWLLALFFPFTVFNYVLGEELLFRGVLLPKMKGTFGRWDWIANGMLFSAYHLHLIWELPSQIIFRDWIYPGANKLFKSFWMSVIIHGLFNTIAIYIIVTLMILGKL